MHIIAKFGTIYAKQNLEIETYDSVLCVYSEILVSRVLGK